MTEREAFEAWHMDEFGWNDAENREWLKRFRAWQASRKQALEDAAKQFNPDDGAWPCRAIIQTIKGLT